MARKAKKTYSRAQQLNDPAKRAKLPMSALTPAQQQQRKQNQRVARDNANPLYDPSAILGGHALATAAGHITDAVLKPKEAALAAQMGMATTQGTALANRSQGYYHDIAAQEAGALARQKALDDARRTQLQAVGTDAQKNIDQARTQEQSIISDRPQGQQGSNRVLDELAAIKANSASAQQAGETAAGAHAANQADYLSGFYKSQGARGAEVGTEALNRLANQQATIRGQQSDLASTRGDTFAENLLKLRQGSFENAATMSGLNIKKSDLQAQIADDKRQASVARAKIKQTASDNAAARAQRKVLAGQSITQQERSSMRSAGIDPDTGKPIPGGKLDPKAKPGKPAKEPQSATTIKRQVNNLSSEIKDALRAGKVQGGTPLEQRRAAAALIRARAKRAKSSVPDDVLSAAIDFAIDGHVSKRNRDILRTLHVQIPASWLPKKTRRPSGAVSNSLH